ncbi:DUF4105 domain-containing protein [Methylotuvimicrobium sp. KM1]|uniref:Lnb N-terminal periplasmic domain-containing protein n=1 Tax=Methylotuvimicrobium sp. KM1 TaxID=3377707 RepID=UPI00384F55BB
MRRFIELSLMALIIIATSVWGALAVYFGDSDSGIIRNFLSAGFGVFSLVTLISLGFQHWRKRCLYGYGVVFSLILIWWLSISPSNDRQWQPDVAKLAHATFDGDKVTVHNIRNFDYRSEFTYVPAYYTKTFDLNKLEGVDLFSVYWMGPAIAHTILSFNFGDGGHLTVSIEARKELSEGYSTIKGFFRQYELIYIVADERDVIRLRTNYRNDPPEQVYLYRLQGPPQNAKRLFLEYLDKINSLNEKPEFYNTLADNCTTAIWLRSRINPEHLRFSWKILLSGYLPEYLYESQRLNTRIPFNELQKQSLINERALRTDQEDDFSRRIRTVILKHN